MLCYPLTISQRNSLAVLKQHQQQNKQSDSPCSCTMKQVQHPQDAASLNLKNQRLAAISPAFPDEHVRLKKLSAFEDPNQTWI